MLNKKWIQPLLPLAFIGLSSLSFLTDSYIHTGYILPVGTKYVVNLMITALAILMLLIDPETKTLSFCAKFYWVFSLPFIVPWLWSLAIWMYSSSTFDYILRGSLNPFYMLTNMLYLCASFYLFKEKTMYYMMLAAMIGNGISMLIVMKMSGPMNIIVEYFIKLFTFAGEAGMYISRLENSDMVYGWGAFFVYFCLHKEKNWKKQIFCIAVSFFFMTLALKRICVLACVVGIVVGYAWRKLPPRMYKSALRIFTIILIVASLAYIMLIDTGLFYQIMEEFEVDLMGRERVYTAYDDFYEVCPTYMGYGLRFIHHYGDTHPDYPRAMHNVFLMMYIELGFWGFCVWLYLDFGWRFHWVGKRYGYAVNQMLLAQCIYLLITYLTDNTMFQFPANTVCRAAAMVCIYEEAQLRRHMTSAEIYLRDRRGAPRASNNRHARV